MLKNHLDVLGFILLGGPIKLQTWLVHEVHGFKLLFLNKYHILQVIDILVNYK